MMQEMPCRAVQVLVLDIPLPPTLQMDPKVLRQAQLDDMEIGPILHCKELGEDKPPWSAVSAESQVTKVYWAQWQSLVLIDGVLYREWENPAGNRVTRQLVLPRKFREGVLSQLHDSYSGGHLQDPGEDS